MDTANSNQVIDIENEVQQLALIRQVEQERKLLEEAIRLHQERESYRSGPHMPAKLNSTGIRKFNLVSILI